MLWEQGEIGAIPDFKGESQVFGLTSCLTSGKWLDRLESVFSPIKGVGKNIIYLIGLL